MAYMDIIKVGEGRHSNPLNLLIELHRDYPMLVTDLDSCTFSKKGEIQPHPDTIIGTLLNTPELNIRTVSIRKTADGNEVLDLTRNGQIWNEQTALEMRNFIVRQTNAGKPLINSKAVLEYKDTLPTYEAKGELEQFVVKFAVNPSVISGPVGDKIRNDHGKVSIKALEIDPDGAVYVDCVSEGQCKGCDFAVIGTFKFAAELLQDRLAILNGHIAEQRPDLNAPELYLPAGGMRVFEGWESKEESFTLPNKVGMSDLEMPVPSRAAPQSPQAEAPRQVRFQITRTP